MSFTFSEKFVDTDFHVGAGIQPRGPLGVGWMGGHRASDSSLAFLRSTSRSNLQSSFSFMLSEDPQLWMVVMPEWQIQDRIKNPTRSSHNFFPFLKSFPHFIHFFCFPREQTIPKSFFHFSHFRFSEEPQTWSAILFPCFFFLFAVRGPETDSQILFPFFSFLISEDPRPIQQSFSYFFFLSFMFEIHSQTIHHDLHFKEQYWVAESKCLSRSLTKPGISLFVKAMGFIL